MFKLNFLASFFIFTYQIGNGNQICGTTKIKTVSDFRALNVAFGGQGAPLVPVGDQLLFGSYDACLNLGGIANISFPKKGKTQSFPTEIRILMDGTLLRIKAGIGQVLLFSR